MNAFYQSNQHIPVELHTSKKKKRMTLGGKIATGTSSTMKELKARLGDKWEVNSAGDTMRALAKERGVDFYDFVFNLPDDADDVVDERTRQFLKKDYVIAEGRCTHGFADREHTVTVLLDASDEVRLERYFYREKRQHPDLTKEEAYKKMTERDHLDIDRFKKVTDTDEYIYDQKFFDLIIDSGKHTLEEVVQEILKHLEN